MIKQFISLFIAGTFLYQSAMADTRTNAISLFEWAESQYPELLTPTGGEIQEIQGFYVRFYADSDVYLGVQGDNVWALGPQLGNSIIYVGKIDSLISLTETDISDAILTNSRANCSYYADNLFSAVEDLKRGILFNGSVDISVEGSECVITTNSIPNHDFNDGSAAFASDVAEVSAEFRIPVEPVFAAQSTAISLETDNAVLLNGVKVDLLAAGCFGVGDGKSGCNDINQPWRFDPMSPLTQFGTDSHNAHTQPDGAYHYHGNPDALFDQTGSVASAVIGFAADGFPIFGSFIEDNGSIREVTSSYRLLSGDRPNGTDDPGGSYDGTYVDDYEYIEGSGDLDECNGMMRNGVYGYYVIGSYPWILACYKGTPDASFNKTLGGGNTDGPGMGDTGATDTGSQPTEDETPTMDGPSGPGGMMGSMMPPATGT